MRLLLTKLAAIVLPIGTLVCLVNYKVDPANIFASKSFVSNIAVVLSAGHNAENIANYDERLLQEQMVLRLTDTPDIVILGSSRVMEIGTDFFVNKKVLNCGVSHANIHDLVAIVGLLDSMKRLPKEIYINLDPWLISENGTSEWQSLEVYHEYFLHKYARKENSIREESLSNAMRKAYTLISFAYFKKSIDFLLNGSSKKIIDVAFDRPSSGRFSDGTISYPSSYTQPDTLKVAYDAAATGKKEGLSQPDPGKVYLLNALLDFLKEKKVEIHFIMLPVHVEFYKAVNDNQAFLFEKYKKLFLRLAEERGISISGNFDPLVLHVGRASFYDMYHCSKAAIQSIGITR